MDGGAFAVVFPRAKHAGAAVLHMQFISYENSLYIDLGLM